MNTPNRSLQPARRRINLWLIVAFGLMMASSLPLSMIPAARAADIGYSDFKFGSSCTSAPTGEKPESKLWWNDGIWWGSLCNPSDSAYYIYRFDVSTQSWSKTATKLDSRGSSKADTLWDGQKLYVVSHVFSSKSTAPSSSSSDWGRLYRYSYNTSTKTYTLDSGFPVNVTNGKSETLVLAKDTAGTLWVTWAEGYIDSSGVARSRLMVNHSTTSDSAWGTPFELQVTGASKMKDDDISSIVAFDGRVGILWSNQVDQKMYFASHADGTADTSWTSFPVYNPGGAGADDHINLKLQSDGKGVYAVTKTSFTTSTAPSIVLLSCKSSCASASNWSANTVYQKQNDHTRAILLLDTTNRQLYVFSTTPDSGTPKTVYYKQSSMDSISFPTGHGTLFISKATDPSLSPNINNVTSTKQNVTSSTGLLVLASDSSSRYYLHNYLSLGGSTPTPTPTPTTPPVSGTRIKDITFEGGSLTGASGADKVGGTVTLETANPIKGSYSARIPSGATAATAYLQEDFTGVDSIYGSFYLKINTLPASDTRLVLLTNAGTTVGNIQLRTTGALRLRVGTTTIGAESARLAVGTVYRIGFVQKKGSGSNAVLEAYLATGDNAFGAPFASTGTGTWTSQANRLRVGATNSAILDVIVDNIKLDTAAIP